jgi:nitrous oxidase accessory protein NosD
MSSKTTLVTTAAQLVSVARRAGAGDTILLAPGNYGDVAFVKIRPSGPVTIRSADPDNDAVLRSLRLTNTDNFVFEDIDVSHTLKPEQKDHATAVWVNQSKNISFVGVDFQGSMNATHFDDGNGLTVVGSSRVAILDSTFQQFNNAVKLATVNDVIFAGNSIRDAREGVHIGTVNGGLFERNYLTNITGDASKGDHADAFQVQGISSGSNDLVFRSNVIIADAQGIFIRSENVARGIFHSNIVVENNYYEGNARNAISVTQANNVQITNNTVREGEGPGLLPAIVVGGVTNALVTNNIAPNLLSRADWTSTNVTMTDNIDVWDSRTRRGVSVDSVFSEPLGSGEIDFSKLDAKGSAAVDVTGIGFRAVEGIGDLGGSAAAVLAAYIPQFDHNFAVVQLA